MDRFTRLLILSQSRVYLNTCMTFALGPLDADGNGSMVWKKYDEQFRLRRSVDPSILWSKIDYELWLMLMQSP